MASVYEHGSEGFGDVTGKYLVQMSNSQLFQEQR
jgi:hypothetical protein